MSNPQHCQDLKSAEQKSLKVKPDSNFFAHEQTSNNIFKVKLEASAVMWCCRNEGRKGWVETCCP